MTQTRDSCFASTRSATTALWMSPWRRIHALATHRYFQVGAVLPKTRFAGQFSTRLFTKSALPSIASDQEQPAGIARPEHAVISTFDLFSVGVGPSSSHTVGPMRAGRIFVNDLKSHGLLDRVKTVKIVL